METTGIIIRMIGVLAIILGLLAIMAWLARRWAPRLKGGENRLIEVLVTHMVAPKRYVSVVRVGRKNLIIGMGEHEMTLLGTIGQEELQITPKGNGADREVKGDV